VYRGIVDPESLSSLRRFSMISSRSRLSIVSSKPSILSIPTPRSSMLSILTPRSSILSKRSSVDLFDNARSESTTKTEGSDDECVSASNSADLPQHNQDHQGSQCRGSQVRRYRRRITFTGVPPIPEQTENDSEIRSCIVITNTIQVEILNKTEPTKMNEIQKDENSSESDALESN